MCLVPFLRRDFFIFRDFIVGVIMWHFRNFSWDPTADNLDINKIFSMQKNSLIVNMYYNGLPWIMNVIFIIKMCWSWKVWQLEYQ